MIGMYTHCPRSITIHIAPHLSGYLTDYLVCDFNREFVTAKVYDRPMSFNLALLLRDRVCKLHGVADLIHDRRAWYIAYRHVERS